ncbi:hypothetical protein [Bradyrhizobium ottawaense]|uniref:hypothetical protein n=1 Tax=Bradyrhizobium ottawaense TaxID=931866 RepID=UPI0034855B0B
MEYSLKILLGLIATGLWANAFISLKPLPAHAQAKTETAEYYLQRIDNGIRLLVNGECANKKLC